MFSCLKIYVNSLNNNLWALWNKINELGCIDCSNEKQEKRNSIKNTFDIKWIESGNLDVDTLTSLHEKNPLLKYLFTHNSTHYYGNRDIMYDSMFSTKYSKMYFEVSNDYELIGNVPHYVIIQYIMASYNNTFDINEIKPTDFINFLEFIDRNPTTVLSIGNLDCQIVKYIDKNNIITESDQNQEILKQLSQKHKLKYTQMFINNS